MNREPIKTKAEYNKAIKRTMQIFHAEEGTPKAAELALLLVLVKDYEDKHIQLPEVDPIEVVKLKMEERGIKAKIWNIYLAPKVMFLLCSPAGVY